MVRARIAEGRLPASGSNKLLAKYGDGTLCSVCGRAVARSGVMYLLGFGRDRAELVMDLACFLAWVAERDNSPK